MKMITSMLIKTASLFFLMSVIACTTLKQEQIEYMHNVSLAEHLNLPNPGLAGSLTARSLLYASSYNPRRPIYSQPEILTETTDLSPYFDPQTDFLSYLGDPSGYTDRINEWHWGYDATKAPINGILWYPDLDSAKITEKFPLVVCMHGNHNAYDVSEFGYDYLGRHLASRGYIFASMDHNYLNARTNRENDVRGILALEHIKTIISWNDDPDSPFYNKIDTENIAVIGHSRGGEGAVLSAVFNKMQHYPDNGNIKWNYDFSIKGIVSLAPVEGQYRPSQKGVEPTDVDYLLLHGGSDGDVTVNMGIAFLNRERPSEGKEYYSYWIQGANHAQFNTGWSDKQDPYLSFREDLITEEEQIQFTKTVVTAFLEASFDREPEYRTFLRDYRSGMDWLPTTHYITTYRDSESQNIADFDEDINAQTATAPDWNLSYSGFDLFREQVLAFDMEKSFYLDKQPLVNNHDKNQESSALYLEWSQKEQSTGPAELILSNNNDDQKFSGLSFDIAVTELNHTGSADSGISNPAMKFVDFTIKLVGISGEVHSILLQDAFLVPPIPGTFLFPRGFSFPEMLQRVSISADAFPDLTADFNLKSIEFVFDKSSAGAVLIDNILLEKGETHENQ